MGKCCARFNDKKGCDTKFYKNTKSYKIQLPDELVEDLYQFSMKYVEQLSRGSSPTSVVSKKKFQKFLGVSEGLGLKALPGGYQNFVLEKKVETVKKLVDELVVELAAALSHRLVQGVDTLADYSDNMQVGASSARQIERTVREDADIQVNSPGQIQVGEGRAPPNPDVGNTLLDEASLQSFDWDVSGALENDSNSLSRSREEEIFPRLDPSYEDQQNVSSTLEELLETLQDQVNVNFSIPSWFNPDEPQQPAFVSPVENLAMLDDQGLERASQFVNGSDEQQMNLQQQQIPDQQEPIYLQQQPIHLQQQLIHLPHQLFYLQQQLLHLQQLIHLQQQPIHLQQQPIHLSQQLIHLQQQLLHPQQQLLHLQQQLIHLPQQPIYLQQQLTHLQQLICLQQQPIYLPQQLFLLQQQLLHLQQQLIHLPQQPIHLQQQLLHLQQQLLHLQQQLLHLQQ